MHSARLLQLFASIEFHAGKWHDSRLVRNSSADGARLNVLDCGRSSRVLISIDGVGGNHVTGSRDLCPQNKHRCLFCVCVCVVCVRSKEKWWMCRPRRTSLASSSYLKYSFGFPFRFSLHVYIYKYILMEGEGISFHFHFICIDCSLLCGLVLVLALWRLVNQWLLADWFAQPVRVLVSATGNWPIPREKKKGKSPAQSSPGPPSINLNQQQQMIIIIITIFVNQYQSRGRGKFAIRASWNETALTRATAGREFKCLDLRTQPSWTLTCHTLTHPHTHAHTPVGETCQTDGRHSHNNLITIKIMATVMINIIVQMVIIIGNVGWWRPSGSHEMDTFSPVETRSKTKMAYYS